MYCPQTKLVNEKEYLCIVVDNQLAVIVNKLKIKVFNTVLSVFVSERVYRGIFAK